MQFTNIVIVDANEALLSSVVNCIYGHLICMNSCDKLRYAKHCGHVCKSDTVVREQQRYAAPILIQYHEWGHFNNFLLQVFLQ